MGLFLGVCPLILLFYYTKSRISGQTPAAENLRRDLSSCGRCTGTGTTSGKFALRCAVGLHVPVLAASGKFALRSEQLR